MLSVNPDVTVTMNDLTGELWARVEASISCYLCHHIARTVVEIPIRSNVFIGCNQCKDPRTLSRIEIRLT